MGPTSELKISTNFEIFVSIQLFASPSAACILYRLVKEKAIILKFYEHPFVSFWFLVE
ncbi:hypothetical protein CICLE_v10010689mg [Citrus x clementina]|uniref:Uncharacterized protein n=1 Tax=Citrus clementina TaxID=85681 RepID=V4WCA5_CITCL|nr:hypothetical protein CICLE_v10010689mg [Citrus x clementina]